MLQKKPPVYAVVATMKIDKMLMEDELANEKDIEMADLRYNVKE